MRSPKGLATLYLFWLKVGPWAFHTPRGSGSCKPLRGQGAGLIPPLLGLVAFSLPMLRPRSTPLPIPATACLCPRASLSHSPRVQGAQTRSSCGQLKRVGSRVCPRLSRWSHEYDSDIEGVTVARGLSVRPECKGPNSQLPPQDSSGSCSVCFLLAHFLRGWRHSGVVGWGKSGLCCIMYIFFKV